MLGLRRGAAAGVNSELLLTGCSSSAASVGQPLLPAAVGSQRHAVSEVFNKGILVTAFVF